MAKNKIIYNGNTLIDLTGDTVTADKLMQGYTAHDRSGAIITGTATGGGSVTQDQDGFIVLPPTGGGGGSNWELIGTSEFEVSTTSTSNELVGNITLDLSKYNNPETIVWVHIRDKAGKRAGYFYGTDSIFFNTQLANGSTNSYSINAVHIIYVSSAGNYSGAASKYGVYAYRLYYTSSSHYVGIYSKYTSTYGTIDGTYKCDVYALKPPTGMTLFEVGE